MLELKGLAVYWNSVHTFQGGEQTNWSSNKEFLTQNSASTIEFSKKFTENLKRKHLM